MAESPMIGPVVRLMKLRVDVYGPVRDGIGQVRDEGKKIEYRTLAMQYTAPRTAIASRACCGSALTVPPNGSAFSGQQQH